MNTKFSTRDIAELKRTAKNVWPLEVKRIKAQKKLEEAQAELDLLEQHIALKEAYVVSTTGHHVMDLVDRVVTVTPALNADGSSKLDEKGKPVMNTTTEFNLKYPETVVPVSDPEMPATVVEQNEEVEVTSEVNETEVDGTAIVEEVETPAAEAPFNPMEV